jgi:hypothetical protein
MNDRNLFFFYDKEEGKKFVQRKMVYFDQRWTIGIFFDDKEEAKKLKVCFRLVLACLRVFRNFF